MVPRWYPNSDPCIVCLASQKVWLLQNTGVDTLSNTLPTKAVPSTITQMFSGGKKKTTSFFDSNWGFPKMVVPNNHGFPTKNDHFGVFWGYHHLRKHPILDGLHTQGWPDRTIELLHRPRKLMVLKSGKLTS